MPAARRTARLAIVAALTAVPGAQAQAPAPDWAAVEQALGRKGAQQPGGVMKFGLPRSDLSVTLAGVTLKPAFALGSWVAFQRAGAETVAMGDLVLLMSEVGPVLEKLQDGQIEQTALHNHLLGEEPRVMYLHIAARGDASRIATTIHDALALTGTPAPGASPAAAPAPLELDTAAIARALGVAGRDNGGVYQVSVARKDQVMDAGMEVPPAMGVATAINFQPIGGGRAAITGDFVMTAAEVNPVLRALRGAGIAVTALHSHMLHESPRLFFMHFWAQDDALRLARGLRAALDRTARAP